MERHCKGLTYVMGCVFVYVVGEDFVAADDESGEEGAEEDDQEDVPDRDQARTLALTRHSLAMSPCNESRTHAPSHPV